MSSLRGPPTFSLKDLEELAEEFSNTHLRDYLQTLRASKARVSRKEINDALWGTISLTPIEISILDSPLLQRLRYVRQLGVVHWVYPGAVHTRLEHTLGVLHQVQHLSQALNALALQRGYTNPLIDSSKVQLLRLCALLHDVGHSAFSHVAEKALEALPGLESLATDFSRISRSEERKISEIFAYYIVKSRAMRDLLDLLLDRYGGVSFSNNRTENLKQVIEKISSAIVGQKIDDRLPLLHEIISGPFDADKLDYYVRDARLAGTPSVLDISRLVQKISIRDMAIDELPPDIGRSVERIDGSYCVFGIKWSGVAMLDELHLARVLLYAKIYRHTKVVAIEQMLRAAFVLMGQVATPQAVFELAYSFGDDALLSLNSEALIAALHLDTTTLPAEGRQRIEAAAKILSDIRVRRLLVKAFELQRRHPTDQAKQDEIQKDALIDFREQLEHPSSRELFKTALIEEVESILKTLGVHPVPSRVVLEATILVHSLGKIPGGAQIARAYLLPFTGAPMLFREYTVNRGAWADAYMSDQPIASVFASADIADAVYIALEKLVRTNYNFSLPVAAMEASKRNPEAIADIKQALHKASYYRGCPYDIRPVPSRLRKADVGKIIGDFSGRLQGYQDPQISDNENSLALVPRDRVDAWIRQFDDNDHVECALQLLKDFKFIGRAEAVTAIKRFLNDNPSFHGGVVVPFGSARDSGSVQAYYAADILNTHVTACCSLEEAAHRYRKLPIIFVDDFIASGGQGTDILAAGFGISSLRRDLDEQREMFEDDIRLHLRSSKLGFVFSAAWDDGISAIQAVAKDLQLDAQVFRLLDETKIPFAFETSLKNMDADLVASFRAKCQQVGKGIIHSIREKEGKPLVEAKIDTRMLGYGNRAMLLASCFNVPSQTLTLIWGRGTVEDAVWNPLLSRRKKT